MQAFGEISTKTRCGRKGLCNVLWAGARRVNNYSVNNHLISVWPKGKNSVSQLSMNNKIK